MDVVILGRIGYDLYSEEPHVPLPRVRRFSRYLGGSSANMAVGLSRLGAHTGMVSCLGDDSLSLFPCSKFNRVILPRACSLFERAGVSEFVRIVCGGVCNDY